MKMLLNSIGNPSAPISILVLPLLVIVKLRLISAPLADQALVMFKGIPDGRVGARFAEVAPVEVTAFLAAAESTLVHAVDPTGRYLSVISPT